MIAFILHTVLAAPPSIDTVQPAVTRAGFLRFDDDRFATEDGLVRIQARLATSPEPRERAALAEWYARVARQLDLAPQAVQLALASPHTEVRRTITEALVRAPEAQLRPLHGLLSDPDPGTRMAVLVLVARSQSPDRAAKLLSALSDVAPEVRATALQNLRILAVEAPVRALVEDPSPQVRLQAALYLKRHEPDTFREISGVLGSDADPTVRRTVSGTTPAR